MPRKRSRIPDGYPITAITTPGGATRYRVILTWHDGGRKQQIRRRFEDLTEAVEFVDQGRVKIKSGAYEARSKDTLAQLIEAWLKSKTNVRQVTRDGYAQVLKPIIRDHGQVQVQKITPVVLDRWVAAWPDTGGLRGTGLSRRSIQMTLTVLKMVFKKAVRDGLLATNPAHDIEIPADGLAAKRRAEARRHSATVWTFDQLDRFVAEADRTELAAAMRLSACGLRRSEVLGLSWDDVDLAEGVIHIRQARVRHTVEDVKSEASRRSLPVDVAFPGTLTKLRELALARDPAVRHGLVVVNEAGEPYDRDHYSKRFREIAKAAGLPPIKLHATRHTLATWLHANPAVTDKEAADWLGHTLPVFQSVYVKSSEGSQANTAAAIGAGRPRAVTG